MTAVKVSDAEEDDEQDQVEMGLRHSAAGELLLWYMSVWLNILRTFCNVYNGTM